MRKIASSVKLKFLRFVKFKSFLTYFWDIFIDYFFRSYLITKIVQPSSFIWYPYINITFGLSMILSPLEKYTFRETPCTGGCARTWTLFKNAIFVYKNFIERSSNFFLWLLAYSFTIFNQNILQILLYSSFMIQVRG